MFPMVQPRQFLALQAACGIPSNVVGVAGAKSILDHSSECGPDLGNGHSWDGFFFHAWLLAPGTMTRSAKEFGGDATPAMFGLRNGPIRLRLCRAESTLQCGARLSRRARI